MPYSLTAWTHWAAASKRACSAPALVVLALILAPPVGAQTHSENGDAEGRWPINVETAPRPIGHSIRAQAPIVVDGRLDEPTWLDAEPLSGFIQSKPNTGYPATENTVVRFAYDDTALYIGAVCYDSKPQQLTTPSLEQDFNSVASDVFGFTLDTYHDRRNGFMFMVNPQGALKDVQLFDDSRSENPAWEGPIQVRTMTHDSGWTVEMAIPFTTLRFNPSLGEQVWGLNMLRRVRRKNEDSFWAPVEQRDRVHKMSKAGTLVGLQGIRPGRNFYVKPYMLAANSSGDLVGEDGKGTDMNGGLDLKYGVTSGLTLDLTYRTDFAQAEVDQEQVNLTRFSLFFPEKRDFFVENSGTFTFGDDTERNYRTGVSDRDFTLFHSRRIGLTGGGEPIPIVGGGRLTGKAGAFEVGLLNMQTEAVEGIPAENFSVLRVRRNLLGSSDIGAIFINRQATGGDVPGYADYNRSYGVDANFRLFRYLLIAPYLAATRSPDQDGNNVAARMWVGWRDRFWDASAFVRQIGDAFNPTVGFVRRRDLRQSYATVGIHPRPAVRGVQEINPYVSVDRITDLESVLMTRTATAGFEVTFVDGGRLSLEYSDQFERLTEPFEVVSDAVIPVGDYAFREASATYRSNTGRAWSGQLTIGRGGFFSGTKTSVDVGAVWRASYQLSLDLSVSHNDIALPDGSFTADVLGGRVTYGFSTKLFASGFVQYNAAADQLVTNVRVNYLHAPLSDLFLVYTERRDTAGGGVAERVLTAKLTKSFGF